MPVEFKEDSIREWVTNNIDPEYLEEVVNQGCIAGTVPELIYYADSCAFYEQYEGEIWDRLDQTTCELGYDSILHLISTFNGSRSVGSHDQFRNLLAWWACEEVCREIYIENEERQQELNDEMRSGWADAETPFAENH